MSTASRNACQNLDLRYRATRPPASPRAWRSIWRRGTRLAGSTSTGYRRNKGIALRQACFDGEIGIRDVRLERGLYNIVSKPPWQRSGRDRDDRDIYRYFALLSVGRRYLVTVGSLNHGLFMI